MRAVAERKPDPYFISGSQTIGQVSGSYTNSSPVGLLRSDAGMPDRFHVLTPALPTA